MPQLLVSEIFPPQVGGSGRWLYELYRRLPAGSVVVAAGEYPSAMEFDVDSGINTVRIPLQIDQWGILSWQGVKSYWRLAQHMRRLAKQYNAQEIHVARCMPEGFAAWLLRMVFGTPYVVFVHGEETRTSASSREYRLMTSRVYRHAKYLVANSENTSAILQKEWSIPSTRIQVLHPGVDAQRYVPTAQDETLRQQLGWQGRAVVLTVGRLQIRKGHDMLIRALPQVRTKVPNILYAIVGEGEERERLEQLVIDCGVQSQVKFHGAVADDDLLRCYQQCDLFALPNREVNGDFEGFGMVLVEAQACGKPVIAGDSGGTHETMDRPRTGLILNCNTPEEIAKSITELMLDEPRRHAMGQAARVWVVEKYDWSNLVLSARNFLLPSSPLAK